MRSETTAAFDRGRLRVGLLVAVIAATAACSSPQAYIVLVLESSAQPITSIAELTVQVSQGTAATKTLTYPAGSLAIGADADLDRGTLSVSFSGDQSGDVFFQVTADDARGCAIGEGQALVTLRRGAITEALVPLAPEEKCTGDAGAPDLLPDSTFPGCEPSALACPTDQTCQIDCQDRSNVCAAAGTGTPGGSCAGNVGCVAGAQCFDYGALGCGGVQACLRYCDSDSDCTAPASGSGPGSYCRDPIQCDGVTLAYHTCSFSCDPTAAASAASGSGCPVGLACVLTASMDHVDCICPEATRTGQENAPCTVTSQCAPGFLCEQTCRAICLCDAQNGACTAGNDCPTPGTTCTPVSNQTIYGVCL